MMLSRLLGAPVRSVVLPMHVDRGRPVARLFSSITQRIQHAVREHLDAVVRRHNELVDTLGDETSAASLSQGELAAASKEIADLSKLVQSKARMDDLEREMDDLRQMADGSLSQGETDSNHSEQRELEQLAKEELELLRASYDALVDAVVDDMLPKDDTDRKGCVVEVRAGTGGEEACLFAKDLFAMYQRFCTYRGWVWEGIEQSASSMGDGYKVAIATVTPRKGASEGDAGAPYGVLKYESGVHRVQRVPATESGGRIHTSAASVTILPEADTQDIEIRDEDVRIDTYRSSGAGGQHVNTTNSAVRVTHIPTGTSVAIQDERSQHKNKAKALSVLRARIYDAEQQRLAMSKSHARKQQIGTGDRSARVRTYNIPQGRVTDHRASFSVHGDLTTSFLLDGPALEEIIEELRLQERKRSVEDTFFSKQ
jgi:peptide chain release factor 1